MMPLMYETIKVFRVEGKLLRIKQAFNYVMVLVYRVARVLECVS